MYTNKDQDILIYSEQTRILSLQYNIVISI